MKSGTYILKGFCWTREEKCSHVWKPYHGTLPSVSHAYCYECANCNVTHGSIVRIPNVAARIADFNCVHEYVSDDVLGPRYAMYKACKYCGQQQKK